MAHCPDCEDGKVWKSRYGGNDPDNWAVKCETCDGSGEVEDEAPKCPFCDRELPDDGFCRSCKEQVAPTIEQTAAWYGLQAALAVAAKLQLESCPEPSKKED